MSEPVLYILMRNDLESMNPGKAMAQAAHAADALRAGLQGKLKINRLYGVWQGQTSQGFGRTIVLSATEGQITNTVSQSDQPFHRHKLICEWVHDPSYPIRDGELVHHIPLNTCAYVFGGAHDAKQLVGHLELHP